MNNTKDDRIQMEDERTKIIAIFEKHRKSPKTPYQEDHFLDFLMANPKQKRAVYNSFSGLRRFNTFMDEIQSEFLIFFSFKDREANYSLDKFVARVKELRVTPRSSLVSLKKQMGPANWNILIFFNVFMFPLLAVFRNQLTLLYILGAFTLAVNGGIFRFYWREKNYNRQLLEKIKAGLNKDHH